MAGMPSPIGPYPGADGLRDPIFKGCTRPAMLAGVPMTWLLLSAGAALIAAPYLLYFVHPLAFVLEGLLYLPFLLWMRHVTRQDDQRLRQIAMRTYMRARQLRSRRHWGAVSYSPLCTKKRFAP